MTSRTIKVEVSDSQSQRMRLETLTEKMIVLDITITESNNCFIIHSTKKVMFLLLTDGKQHKAHKLDMIIV